MRFILLGFLLLWTGQPGLARPKEGIFSGRISRVNLKAKILRIKVNFSNLKYLNKGDQVEFRNEIPTKRHCKSYVLGKSGEHLLLKVPQMKACARLFALHPGVYLRFFGQDLVNNIKMGRELVDILLKKRLAIKGLAARGKRDLEAHREKIDATNQRYRVLREKLEAQWRDAIGAIERDRLVSLEKYQKFQGQLANIDRKLERYRINDENLEKDRWALDRKLHFEK